MRHRITQALDTPSTYVGDAGFIGVNMRLDPSQLPAGYVSEAINARFRNGVAENRLGFVRLPWMNKTTTGTLTINSITRSGTTATATTASAHGLRDESIAVITGATQTQYNGVFIVAATGSTTFTFEVSGAPATPATGSPVLNTYSIQPWGEVNGIGDFKDHASGVDYTVIAADGAVYYTSECNVPQSLSLPSGVEINDDVTFTQAYDHLIMFRGENDTELEMARISGGFQNIVQTDAGDGTERIPNAVRGEFFQNRLFIPNNRDEIAVSDFGDYTRYQPVTQELKVNTGSNDSLVTIVKFGEAALIAFKDRSIYALANVHSDLTEVVQDQITDQIGLVAANSVAQCGADLLFLSQMGVTSIRQTEQNKLQGVLVPLSDAIQPLIDRINWKHASNAQAAYWDNRYYLAVPMDDAEILGPELAGGTLLPQQEGSEPPVGVSIRNLEVGATYRFVIGNTASLANGAQTISRSEDFVATDTEATITATFDLANTECTASLKRLHSGVNNVVLVYDFLNQAWSGYDQADGFAVKRFHLRKYRGLDRLFAVTHEGWIVLYEEDYQDQLMSPYTEVVVASTPAVGNVLEVNGGTIATAANDAQNTAPNTWGCSTLANARINIWVDSIGVGGYGGFTDEWTVSNAIPVLSTNGVRFYGTNGIPPVARTTGTWATVTENSVQDIPMTIVTRGLTPDVDLSDFSWLCFDAQTWNPDYSVTMLMDGVEEERAVSSSITKSRTRYTIWGRPDYDATNTNLDHDTNHREDYSVAIGDGSDETSVFSMDSSEVSISRHQQFREEFKVRNRGRSARVKFVTSQGRLRLLDVRVENRKLQTKAGGKT